MAESIERALADAAASGITNIVLTVDSPGGSVEVARSIVANMQEYAGKLNYCAVVERGISAAIWPVFCSDHIFVRERSIIGGAVAYSTGATGDVRVDEKLSSILAAELATMAQAKGHSALLVRAMMMKGVRVYAWRDGAGNVRVTSSPPAESPEESRTLNTEGSILTLTGAEAVEIQLAQEAPRDLNGIGELLGGTNWNRANYHPEVVKVLDARFRRALPNIPQVGVTNFVPLLIRDAETGLQIPLGHVAVAGASSSDLKRLSRLQGITSRVSSRVLKLVHEIEANDPEAVVYPLDSNGDMTEVGKQQWRDRRSKVLQSWRALHTILAQTTKQLKTGMDNLDSVYPIDNDWPPSALEAIWARRGIPDERSGTRKPVPPR